MKHDVGSIDDFPRGACQIIDVAGKSIGVVNVDDDLYAVLNICPHMHAPICQGFVAGTYLPSRPGERLFGLDGRVLSCPWHFWEYDVTTGESLFGVDHRKLKTFPVEVEGERVFVEVGR